MDHLLLEGTEEALGNAGGFGLTDQGVAWAHAPEADLLLEVLGDENAAVVMAERNRAGGRGVDTAEDAFDHYADGLGSSIAITALG